MPSRYLLSMFLALLVLLSPAMQPAGAQQIVGEGTVELQQDEMRDSDVRPPAPQSTIDSGTPATGAEATANVRPPDPQDAPGGEGMVEAIETEGAPDDVQRPVPEAVPGGVQTREEIMARQRGLSVEHTLKLRNVEVPPPAPDPTGKLGTLGGYSDAQIWRQIRGGTVASPSSDTATGQLMQVLGEEWRLLRNDYLVKYAIWIILGMVGLLALFYLIRGRIRIRGGYSGKTIPRFSMSHRIAHWYLACSFILMAISGLIILLGRPLLVPVIGKDANAVITSAALQGHNLFGPVFILALVIVIFRFMKGNFFQWADLKWIIKGGGILGGHAPAEHYNFGEKTWYWVIFFVGLLMSATGLLLEFPWLVGDLAWHQAATLLHGGGAILLIVGALGHIYIGTIGMEGALDSMLLGVVDENWAKEHHDLWYEEVTGRKAGHDSDDESPATPALGETA